MACFGLGTSQVKEQKLYPFTSFVLKVDTIGGGWEKTVAKILKKTNEIADFRFHENGMVQVSGTVDPVILLKVMGKSGKEVQIVGWKFGGCSRNLYMHEYQPYLAATRYDAYNNYYRHQDAYGGGDCSQWNHLHHHYPRRAFHHLFHAHPEATTCHHHRHLGY